MSKLYTGIYYRDALLRDAKRQAIKDMVSLQKEYIDRLPKDYKPTDRLIFDVNSCTLNPKRIKQALENNIVILLPL